MSNVENLLTAITNGDDISNFQCHSRMEEYLKNIALGESCEHMTPQSRVEKSLKKISVDLSEGQNPTITKKLGGDY